MRLWGWHLMPSKEQVFVMKKLTEFRESILGETTIKKRILPTCLINRMKHSGIYIFGNVGSGKTSVLDWFSDSISAVNRERIHFNEFMLKVHKGMMKYGSVGNYVENSLKNNSKKVICLDELQVNDIADAMVLKELLEKLERSGIKVITTSNIPPHELYLNGIQRENFLPCISFIKKHYFVLKLSSEKDLRLIDNESKQTKNYFNNIKIFESKLTQNDILLDFDWFNQPVGSKDIQVFLSKAGNYEVFLKNAIPLTKTEDKNARQRFIIFIDSIYDKKIKLNIHSKYKIEEILSDKPDGSFKRTISRLQQLLRGMS